MGSMVYPKPKKNKYTCKCGTEKTIVQSADVWVFCHECHLKRLQENPLALTKRASTGDLDKLSKCL
jgi:hypothetical protein